VPRTLVFSSEVYSVETVKKAAYRFSDLFSIDIFPRAAEIECVLTFASEQSSDEQERIVAAFKSEVLDQDLRAVVAKETEAIRNAVLAHALSKTGLQGSE